MKTPAQITAYVERRLKSQWHTNLVGRTDPGWPQTVALGEPAKAELENRFEQYRTASLTLRQWAAEHDLQVRSATRLVRGTTQPIPTHFTVDSIDAAARLCGNPWPARIARGRARLTALQTHGFAGDLTRVVREVDGYTDVDFELLCSTTVWFRANARSARGLTPRQVPVPGLQAKWLNTRHRLIATLAGLDDLGLALPHPPRIHFTYLDPDHRAAGGRHHDSASIGDRMTPAYSPRVVLISENKDTAVGFPEIPGGIAVEGAGTGGSTPAAIGWLRNCPTIVYWGDLDADGLTILHQYREAGLPVVSLLMDVATYDTYAEFGTHLDRKGASIRAADRRELPDLTASERLLYDRLTDPAWTGYRRLEQERIPLPVAKAALLMALATGPHVRAI